MESGQLYFYFRYFIFPTGNVTNEQLPGTSEVILYSSNWHSFVNAFFLAIAAPDYLDAV